MTLREIGAEYRRAREERKLSQTAVAEKAEVYQVQVSLLERGELNAQLETLMRIADAMDCTLELRLRSKGSKKG